MKTIAFAAALMIGGAAVAQTTPMTPQTPPGGSMPAPGTGPMTPQTPPPTDSTTGSDGSMTDTMPSPTTSPTDPMGQPGMQPGSPMSPQTTMTPGQPGMQPGMPGMNGGQVQFAPQTNMPAPQPRDSYPVCSRTVTDGCRNPGGR